jgi:hypothetical protein
MTFREVLQIEIWSKRTSRKILKIVGLSFATIVVAGGIIAGVELQWITPPERTAGRIALARIEDLQKESDSNEDEYKSRKEQADAAVESAQDAAWTLRDRKLAYALLGYAFVIDSQHDEPKRRAKLREFYQKHPPRAGMQSQQDLEAQQDRLSKQVNALMHEVLHGALD